MCRSRDCAFFLAATAFSIAASAEPFSFLAVGDVPYNATQTEAFSRSIDRMGESNARFVLHVGDIKARVQPCEPDLYEDRFHLYNKCEIPFVVLVGDNEFNDCPDPAAALGLFRRHFAQGDESLGMSRMNLERQSLTESRFPYPEQIRWTVERVRFLGLNVVGSANNFGATEEWMARTEAGVAWLAESFERARTEEAQAVVVGMHANPFGDLKGRGFPEPYAPIMSALVEESEKFGKPVLIIHGDSHYFRWDIPFPLPEGKGVRTNLSRLEVFGSPNPHWVEVEVDPDSDQPFSVRPHFLRDK